MLLREQKIERDGVEFRLGILELDNAVLVFFSEGTFKLGTVAVALPKEEAVISSVVLGGKYLVASRALAERASATYKKIALASIHTRVSEGEVVKLAVGLLERLLSDET
jgi:hypothetical protein